MPRQRLQRLRVPEPGRVCRRQGFRSSLESARSLQPQRDLQALVQKLQSRVKTELLRLLPRPDCRRELCIRSGATQELLVADFLLLPTESRRSTVRAELKHPRAQWSRSFWRP